MKKIKNLALILSVLILFGTGMIVGMFIPKNYGVDYEQINVNETSGYFKIDFFVPDNYTVDEIEKMFFDTVKYAYNEKNNLLSCSFSTTICWASVQFITESNCFIRYAHRYADDSLHTSIYLSNSHDNYFSIQITFWKLIVK